MQETFLESSFWYCLCSSTTEHLSSWITGDCQSPLLEKYWRGRDLNPGLLHDRRSTNWATDHAGRNEWFNFDWWLLSFTARPGISAYKFVQPVYDERMNIQQWWRYRWQHPELTGIALWDKVIQQLKHSTTSFPKHPSTWITLKWYLNIFRKSWEASVLNVDCPGPFFFKLKKPSKNL